MGKLTLTPILPSWKAVIRPEDGLVLYFQFGNLRLTNIRGQLLIIPNDTTKPSFLGVWHQPQHLAEQAFTEQPPEAFQSPAKYKQAGLSCLRFTVNAKTTIPYTVSGLLQACMTLTPYLQNTATFGVDPGQSIPGNFPSIHDPRTDGDALSTPSFLEVPWGLFLSPNQFARWKHPVAPVTSYITHFTELWHTRLLPLPASASVPEKPLTLRAIWSVDYEIVKKNKNFKNPAFTTALSAADRFFFVEQTSNFSNFANLAPINVKNLTLSSLGAWLDVHAAWAVGDRAEWVHQAVMGRDYYVRVTARGFLFPFGHRASLVTVTERKFETVDKGNNNQHRVAVLRQKIYIVVNETDKAYPNPAYQFPFQRVRITTTVTPDLSNAAGSAFFPMVNNHDFQFSLELTDGLGHQVDFKMPLFFVQQDAAYTQLGSMQNVYNSAGPSRRQTQLRKQIIAYQPQGSANITKSLLETETMLFKVEAASAAQLPELKKQQQVPIFPQVESFAAVIPVLKALTENTPSSEAMDAPKEFILTAPNAGSVFARFKESGKLGTSFPVEKVGGLVRPDLSVEGISSVYGPVGDIAGVMQNTFNPKNYFDTGALPKLFGVLDLTDILPAIQGEGSIPKITREALGDTVTTSIDWSSDLVGFSVFEPQPGGRLSLNTKLVTQPGSNKAPSLSVTSALTNFDIVLAGVIRLKFNAITFFAPDGKKVDVAADFQDVVFEGALSFLDKIRQLIPLQGFIDPPNLDVTTEGVTAGYTLGLPSIEVGAFALQNVSLSADFCLPFLGDPMSVRFAFCERENPFLLTVSMFAGGGFFGIALSPDGIDLLEASLEFGGNISLNLGVASGGVYVMAGVYFKYDAKEGTQLSGYLRCGGALRVLKIMTVSVEFYMELRYEFDSGKAVGSASVRVKVKIAFFSKSVSLKTQRKFSGSTGDPFFDQTTTPADWAQYCNAFGTYLN